MERKRVLVASAPDGQYLAEKALSLEYDLQFVSTLREAQQQLLDVDAHFEMVICGIHFDDSRMFKLLQFVRLTDGLENIPFLVFQAKSSILKEMNNVRNTAESLGACGFIELHELPAGNAQKLLRQSVGENFYRTVKRQRCDS